jgi:dolichol-phosphate mannosyltransferase
MDQIKTETEQSKKQGKAGIASKKIVSLVVPTYNERDNIGPLVESIASLTRDNKLDLELIIVDDDSPDGTSKVVFDLQKDSPVKLITRRWRKGLS